MQLIKEKHMSSMPVIFWVFATTTFLVTTTKSFARDHEGHELELCSSLKHDRWERQDLSKCNLTEVPPDVPLQTTCLDLSYNGISRLSSQSLAGLPHLCLLKINNNKIKHISPLAFSRCSGLKVLNISHNLLTTIPDFFLPQLTILDISANLYYSYRLGNSFANLTNLRYFALGGLNAKDIQLGDFVSLRNISLKRLSLESELQQYEPGSLAQVTFLKEIFLTMSFCQQFHMFNTIIMDLNQTKATTMRLSKFLPSHCQISSNPFEGFKVLHFLNNITFVDTWFNSSVMEKLLESVVLSHLQQIEFIDIVYNEDTPEGVQFYPKSKYPVKLTSVIFDGVRHYQYSYPKINISVTYISKMTYLKFSGTGMNISPCNLISAIPSLLTLDLSNNLLSDDGFWWPSCSYMEVFPVLKQLLLSHNRFVRLSFISKKTQQMKVLESLDLSYNSIQLDDTCSWPIHLIELSLSNNNLGNDVFNYLSPHFKKINLSKTSITAITQKALSSLSNLTHLMLTSNSIQFLPPDLQIPTLLVLHVDQNAITSISQELILGLPELHEFKVGNNPFSCNCDLYWFVTSLNKSLLPDWPMEYTCRSPPSFAGMFLDEYKPTRFSCSAWLQASIGAPVFLTIITACSIIFYICDGIWYTKMLWVWVQVKRRGHKGSSRLQNVHFRYHAFISYSQHDSGWVESQLVANLERIGLSLCIHERDFIPGRWVMDNIISCVEDSYKTLFVLTQNFVQSDWCNYELFFAQHRAVSIHQDSLVFILLEPIPTDSLPKKFLKMRTLLREQTYLEWPKDEHKQQIFWASLKVMLHRADKNMILKDVATDIADTLPLMM